MWAFVVRFLTYLIVVGVSLALTSHTADQALTAPAALTFQLPEAPQAPACVLSAGVCAEFTWQVADRCRIAIPVPTEGTYYVLQTVRAHDGEATSTIQRVSISDVLIVSIGDSYASGEGNPDVLFGPTAPAGGWQARRGR